MTLIGDLLKGAVPVWLAMQFDNSPMTISLVGLAALAGHCFPIFFGFNGGKGVATAIAATVGFNWIAGAILIATWLVIAKVFRISSLAAIIAFAVLPLVIYWREQHLLISLIFVTLSVILIWRHKSNIQRMIQGNES